MAALSSYLFGFPFATAKRLIAVDAGSHAIKVLLAERRGKQSRIVRREIINLHEEGLISPEEIGRHLHSVLRDFGDYPVALALPRHSPLSHILDIQAGGSNSVQQMIDAEALKNRDLRDSAVVYDCARLEPFGRHQNAFLVTLCKENDVFQQLSRLSLPEEDICEVSSSGASLARAWREAGEGLGPAALVDIGADGTLVTLFVAGQEVFTSTFPIGGNLITEAIAAKNDCTVEVAESLKQTKDFFAGADAVPSVISFIAGWREQLERIVKEWLQDNPEANLSPSAFKVILAGGGAKQPGLLQYLNSHSDLKFVRWPAGQEIEGAALSEEFVVASGTALRALETTPQSASLMPSRLRADWGKRRVHQYVLAASFAVLCVTLLLLLVGSAQKYSVANRKDLLLAEAKIALERAETTDVLKRELAQKYERIRPILRRQQQTLDTLNVLGLLEKSRNSSNLWYVVFADQATYFARPLTNSLVSSSRAIPLSSTNQKNGFVAELCLSLEGEPMRQALAQVVGELKQSSMFNNVDTLSSDLRRNYAETNVIIPDRHFALSLELPPDAFAPSTGERAINTNGNGGNSAARPVNPFSLPR